MIIDSGTNSILFTSFDTRYQNGEAKDVFEEFKGNECDTQKLGGERSTQ